MTKKSPPYRVVIWLKALDVVRDLIRAATWIGCAYYAVQGVSVLADKNTQASFLVAFLTSKENDYGLPWIIAGFMVLLAFAERRLRYRKTEYFQERIKELERQIDPKRSSSGLAPTGETNMKDKL